jgi:tetratricopeptide (TPR) repeat protein
VREVVYGELNALRRSRLHRAVADALIARDPELHLEDIAHHLFESAAAGDERRTAEYLERAGRRAVAQLAYEAAAGHFERALQVAGEDGELLVGRGDALMCAGEPAAARECFLAAAALARAGGDGALLARAALGHAGIGVSIVEVDAATVALLQEALDGLDDGAVELRSQLLARLAVELYYAPSRDRSEALSAAAVAVARRAGDPRTLAAALGARHVALWRPDRLDERLAAAAEMIAAGQAASDPQLELQARNWRVTDLFELGDLAGWRAEAARHAALAERLRLPAYAWYTPLWRAVDVLHHGRYAEAAELREQARELGRRAGDRNADLFADMLLFQDRFMRDDHGALPFGWIEEKIERSPAGNSYRSAYAWALAALGRADEARAQLDVVAADGFAALPFDANWLSAIAEAAEACMRLRDPSHAAALYERLLPYAGRPATAGRAIVSYGAADRHLGGLAALLGRRTAAAEHLEAALRLDAAWGMEPWLERTRRALAELGGEPAHQPH